MNKKPLPELIANEMEKCVVMVKDRMPDGQGGQKVTWKEGAPFDAAIKKNNTLAAVVAEKDGVTEVYNVTTRVGVGLDFGEVFKRKSDGATFRVKSNAKDSETPKAASFSFERVKAERWELT